jgi:lysophospholipase L1-like esterase
MFLVARIIFSLIMVVFVGFLVAFCGNSSQRDIIKPQTAKQGQTRMLKILSLGDSYTIGRGLQRTESWPEQLAAQLRKHKREIDTPVIVAATGWTTKDLLMAIANSDLKKPYDLVTLLIGANDQFQGFGEYAYSTGFQKLLLNSIELAGGRPERVIVVSIPDYSVTKFGEQFGSAKIKAGVDYFNIINKRLAQSKGVYYVNVTEISQRAAEDSTLLGLDGLHPSAKMYAEWVTLIRPVVLEALGIENYND